MKRFKILKIGPDVYKNDRICDKILKSHKFDWLFESEFENADIEIKNNTIIWNSGDYYSGYWKYGIFRSGNFYGKFINGIFESGNLSGEFISGIKKDI